MFISKIRAGSEDRSPFGDFWFTPVSSRSSANVRVTPDTAMMLSAVFRAVSLISGHIAMLPIVLRDVENKEPNRHHYLNRLLKKPNRWQNGFEWRQMLQGHLMLRGTAFNEIIDNAKGEIEELIPLHPDRVKIEVLPSGEWRYRVTDADGNIRILKRSQVWKLCGLSSNGMTGLSVIEAGRESMGLGLAAQSYGSRFFTNDAKPSGGWVEYPGQFKDAEARKVFRETIQDAQSDANRGKLMVLDRGMKYHEVGLNNQDAQFLETRQFQVSEVARWFGVPPHKLAELERATFSNIEQQALEYVTDSLLIWAEIWEAGIEDILLLDDDQLEAEFDFEKLLRGDSATRFKNYGMAIKDGWMVRNEARRRENMKPLPGLDEPLRPLNMVEESSAEEGEDGKNKEGDDPKEGGDSQTHGGARRRGPPRP